MTSPDTEGNGTPPSGQIRWRRSLGATIAALRGQAGISQQSLGSATGLGQTVISRIETGQRRVDTGELLGIAAQLGVEIADLLALSGSNADHHEHDPQSLQARFHHLEDTNPGAASALSWVPGFLADLAVLDSLVSDG